MHKLVPALGVALLFSLGSATAGAADTLPSGAGFYVMQPEDGRDGHKPQRGSGAQTADAVETALAPRAGRIVRASSPEDIEDALATARGAELDYVLQTEILAWEDHETAFTGVPDRISLKFEIYDAASGEELVSKTVQEKTTWAKTAADRPEFLLPEPVEEFMQTAFGGE